MQLVFIEYILCGYVAYYTVLDHNGDTCIEVYHSAGSFVYRLEPVPSVELLSRIPDEIT